MPGADVQKPDDKAASPPIAREHMDLDLDLDVAWPFDPVAFLSGSPTAGFLLSAAASPTAPQLSQLSDIQALTSPLCQFDDSTPELPGLSNFASDSGSSANVDGATLSDSKRIRPLLSAIAEDSVDISCIIKEKMTLALRQFKESTDQHVLVQVWAPVKNGDKYVLTTSGQPFILGPHSASLFQYRTVSTMYLFAADGNKEGYLGLPGRVFCKKLPEWTPDVQYYSSREYPRLNYALNYNVRGTLALPVFEPSCQACVGVVELIMTSPKINYAHEVGKVCKALEAVNLKSSEILDHPSVQICNEGRQAALAGILEILSVVCETHKLPLAQTWVPCRHGSVLAYGGGSKSCSSFDGSCMGQICMSTTDAAFYVIDPRMWGFRDACAEHHLQKDQGVAGMAFSLRRPCFSSDITQFCKTRYPLVHYARMFELASCLAICLRSSHSGEDDYVLEFFLPTDCKSDREQRAILKAISCTIEQCLRSLTVVFKSEVLEEFFCEIFYVAPNENDDFQTTFINQITETKNTASPDMQVLAPSQHGKIFAQNLFEHASTEPLDRKEKTPVEESKVLTTANCAKSKRQEKRRGKVEKTISLEVLQQHFAGSLKDAAKSLGVCPTTMKRICRQHGISRWPSRKINKVSRSLSKLKQVIESVQGAEGTFNLTSLSPCPVPVSSNGWPNSVADSQQNDSPASLVGLLEGRGNTMLSEKSPSDTPSLGEPFCRQPPPDQRNPKQEVGRCLHGPRTSSSEESAATPISHGSSHGSPTSCSNPEIQSSSRCKEPTTKTNGPTVAAIHLAETPKPPTDDDAERCGALVNETARNPPLSGMLAEDAGSSKDLKNLCHNSSGEACMEGHAILSGSGSLRPNPLQDLRTVTIKASYKEDIIRFRMKCDAGMLFLKDEVAKRLKLDIGTFDVKYLDDDSEWVLLACDIDLEECLEVSRKTGVHVIRLLVHDTIPINHGSSCESSGG